MKIIKLCMLSLIVTLLSCSTSDELNLLPDFKEEEGSIAEFYAKDIEDMPYNPENPYDIAGALNNQFYDLYFENQEANYLLSNAGSAIESIANGNSNFKNLNSKDYTFDKQVNLDRILNCQDSVLHKSIQLSITHLKLRDDFEQFLERFMYLCCTDATYKELRDTIFLFEASVLTDASIVSKDARVLLVTTSILRHSVCKPRRRPKKNTDPDWDIMVTSIAASIEGAYYHIQDAIVLSLAAEITKVN